MFLLEDIVQVRESKEYPYVNIGSHWEQLGTLFIQHKYTHTYIYYNYAVYFVLFLHLFTKFLRAHGNNILKTYISDITLKPNHFKIS